MYITLIKQFYGPSMDSESHFQAISRLPVMRYHKRSHKFFPNKTRD